MKMLIPMKNLKKAGIFSLLLIAMAMLSITSCNKDDDDINPGGGEAAKSAWLIGYRINTPQGSVKYMEVHEDIPTENNIAEAVELGFNARVYSYGGHPYTWNGDVATITKWDVDKTTLDLTPSAILSFASTAISGNVGPPIFLSETQAFTSRLSEGVIIEWNPSTMEISKVHNVDPLPDLGGGDFSMNEWAKYSGSNGKIIMPVTVKAPNNCCESSYLPQPAGAMVAVFDPASSTIQYNRDDRLYANWDRLLQDPVTGGFHLPPGWANSFIDPYFDTTGLPNRWSVLKINQDGSFDPDFNFDLTEVIGISQYQTGVFVFDNQFVMTYIDTADYEHPSSWGNRWDVFSEGPSSKTKQIVIDMDTKEVSPFTAFSEYDGVFLENTIDDVSYFNAGKSAGGQDLLRQNGVNDYIVTMTIDGEFEAFDKLW